MIALLKGLLAGTVNLGLGFATGFSLPGVTVVAAAGVLWLLGIGVSLVMFILALRHLGTARTGAYYSLAPFIEAGPAIAVVGEPFTVKLLLAGALMGLGLWLHLSERHEHEHEHEVMEHDHAHTHDDHHRHAHDGPVTEPHAHWHRHERMRHKHPHYLDLHQQHSH